LCLAEVIGIAIAFQFQLGLPLIAGALLTALDAFLILFLINKGVHLLDAFVIALPVVIASCFASQIAAAAPPLAAVMPDFAQSTQNHDGLGDAQCGHRNSWRHCDAA
jgi:manganese transport protein